MEAGSERRRELRLDPIAEQRDRVVARFGFLAEMRERRSIGGSGFGYPGGPKSPSVTAPMTGMIGICPAWGTPADMWV
jgi:hypothetical protein